MLSYNWLIDLPELTTVQETNDIDEDELRQQLQAEIDATDAADADAVAAELDIRRASANSRMSGTTAKTSFSQEEIGELDPEVMVDVLPQLSAAADDLAKLIVPADPKARAVMRKEIRTPGSRYNKLYINRLNARNLHKDSFGHTEYIQPTIALRALLAVQTMKDVPQETWRPDSVIYKINLAQMLNCILILMVDNAQINEEGRSAIDNLDVHFSAGIAGQEFKQNAFEFWLAFLTQLSIIHVTQAMHHPDFNAEKVVMNAFYAPDTEGDMSFKYRNVLHMFALPEEQQTVYTEGINQLVHQLVDTFTNGGTTMAALGALRARYPWEAFVEQTVQYYFERKAELDVQIDAVGGLDGIMLALNVEVDKRKDAREAELKRLSFSRPGGTPNKSFPKSAIKSLRAREKQLAASAGVSSTAPVTIPVAQMTDPAIVAPASLPVEVQVVQQEPIVLIEDDGYQRLDDDDVTVQPSQAQSTARSTLATMERLQATQRQQAQKGKGRSFMERQEGATRVEFDGSQHLTDYQVPPTSQYPASTAPARGPYFQQSPRRPAGKRAFVEDEEPEDFEPTQDQGFQVDTRDISAAADQRRREAPRARPSQARQSAVAASTQGPSGILPTATQASATPSPSKRPRKNPGSTIPAPLAPYDPDDDEIPHDERMKRAKVAARQGTMFARHARPSQVRTPWSDEEELALMNLIEEEGGDGIHYSKLKALDQERELPMLGRRSAEDMRFKARNMKETFLK